MKAVLLALAGAVLSVAAFPPFGPGFLILPGIGLFLAAIRVVGTRMQGLWIGLLYGSAFFAGLMWWLSELELIALILIPVQGLFYAVLSWWLAGHRAAGSGRWLIMAVGGWAVMELVRYHFPFGGLEWGAAGYALSDSLSLRLPAAVVGTSGLTILVAMMGGVAAIAITDGYHHRVMTGSALVITCVFVATVPTVLSHVDGLEVPVAIVQGSTPCPFQHCPPNERLRTYQQHLELTRSIEPGSVSLVVWPEGSTGSTNADPVLNEEVREFIGAEARRIGAPFLVGGDRTISDIEWINANVFFDARGQIVGEYRKQHPVPFGEYVPLRPVFEWIPALDRVPRDMIRGEGPAIFDVFGDQLGSVISYEGGFSRYPLETRRAGANVIVVNTNNASYGLTPATDIWVGMTRMRAVELGVPVIHAAVTGRSTLIDTRGDLGAITGVGTQEVLYGSYGPSMSTPYRVTGDLLMYLAALIGMVTWARPPALVGSAPGPLQEE